MATYGGPSGPTGPSDIEGRVPTCYRHPGRETWVRCTRCDRPICPDCMRDAAVGFQCVECVRGGNRTQRRPTTVFGGRVGRSSTAVVTWTIVGINVVMYIAQRADPPLTFQLGMSPIGIADGEWYRLISAAFLHSPRTILHILFNMWALIVLGPALEALLGRSRFIALYLLSALGGSALSYLLSVPSTLSIGASGAIFGLFGATFVVARRLRLDTRWIIGLLVINLALSFWGGIDWRAHIGGLVTGLIIGSAFAYAPRASRLLVQIGSSAVMLAVIALIVVLRTGQLA